MFKTLHHNGLMFTMHPINTTIRLQVDKPYPYFVLTTMQDSTGDKDTLRERKVIAFCRGP